MIDGCNEKNKIELSDYNYLNDIQRRLFLSRLNESQVKFLNEVIWGSLKTSIQEIAENLEWGIEQTVFTADQLTECPLFTVDGEYIMVDKEMRRQYETELERFEEGFHVTLSWIRNLFSKLPKHLLLEWYVTPRCSDDIFESIIQKNMTTPKVYERYISEIQFEDPIFEKIIEALTKSEDWYLPISKIVEMTGLDEVTVHEYILHLEFNLIAFLSFKKKESGFEAVITPFNEWKEYLQKKRSMIPQTFFDQVQTQKAPFQLIEEITEAVEKILGCSLEKEEAISKEMIQLLIDLELCDVQNEELVVTIEGNVWLEKGISERAIYYLRHPFTKSGHHPLAEGDLRVRELELSLDVIDHGKWVPYKSLVKSIKVPLKNHEPVSLVKKGVKWSYQIPQYGDEEELAVSAVFENRLVKGGVIEMGGTGEESFVRLTSFGKQYIS